MARPGRGYALAILAGLMVPGVAGMAFAQDPVDAWGVSTFGYPGLIDMPVAYSRPDGELSLSYSYFRNQNRVSASFQISDRLSATFRYAMPRNIRGTPDSPVFMPENNDRSFSVHYRFMNEGDYMPAMAIGVNDIMGTGIYSGEYVVASKTLSPRLRATLGLGWGRLGRKGGFSNPFSVFGDRFDDRPDLDFGRGGNFQPEVWFRGNAAFFGGVEWAVNDRLRLTAEYSSDDYAREDGGAFTYHSPVNLGVDWQYNERTNISAHYLYGSELGIQLTYALNPRRSPHGSGRDTAPPAVISRDFIAVKSWGDIDQTAFPQKAAQAMATEGLHLDGIEVRGNLLRVQISNSRYSQTSQAIGRAARVLSRIAPAEVSRFDIVIAEDGSPVTSASFSRSDLEAYETHPVAPDLMRAATVIIDQTTPLPVVDGRYPQLSFGLAPYLTPSYFDPDEPLRIDLGLTLSGRAVVAPGLVFSGTIQQKLVGNLDEVTREANSVLPNVRTSSYLYNRNDGPILRSLTGAYYFRPGENLFGRVTVGYLEAMYGGLSGEILWKPGNSALALGAEVNYVKQRDFDKGFGFQDYEIATGHLSAYYQFNGGYAAQLDVGRYLAGDVGATLTLSREFDNGWKVGAFATKTDVSAEDFGEGSFDKGILLTIPLDWALGRPDRDAIDMVLRPLTRDGGQRVSVDGRLYDRVRNMQPSEMDANWARFWK